MVTYRCLREVGCFPPVVSETTFETFLNTFFVHIARADNRMDHIRVFFNPLFLDCHAIGNDLPVDHDELGFVRLNRTCGRSTSAWCQVSNGLRIVKGGNGQWKWIHSRMGYALDADDV